jgi:hypothetical protein
MHAKNMQKASNFGKGGVMLSRHPNVRSKRMNIRTAILVSWNLIPSILKHGMNKEGKAQFVILRIANLETILICNV